MSLFLSSERPFVMGIVNVTPDSFSGDGVMRQSDFVTAAVDQALRMMEEGADIVDIGGESSRPGAVSISADEEKRRVVPVVEALKKRQSSLKIAVDTIKASVAQVAIEAGASIINDISALAADPTMGNVVATSGAFVVLTHNRSNPDSVTRDAKLGGHYHAPAYDNIVEDVKKDLGLRIEAAKQAGIKPTQIVLDPGLGFGKTVEQNLALINHLDRLKALGYPVLVGPSRKSFIGHVLDVPVDERLEGTAATIAAAVLKGADIIRVHDVKFMARVVKMSQAIKST